MKPLKLLANIDLNYDLRDKILWFSEAEFVKKIPKNILLRQFNGNLEFDYHLWLEGFRVSIALIKFFKCLAKKCGCSN